MWLSKIKKKKTQYILLGVIFSIAIALISVSLMVTAVSKIFAEKYYEGDSTPDIQIITGSNSVIDKTYNWYKDKGDKSRNYKNYDIFSVSTNLSFNDEANDNMSSYIVPIDDIKNLSNKLEIVEGDKNEKAPKKGEVWVSSTTASLKNIKVGDKSEIINGNGKILKYKVSAIVNDSNQSSSAMGMLYVYINELERENLKSLPPVNMITMNCDGNPSELANELVKYINEPIGGIIADKSLYIMAASMTSLMLGGLGLMSSIILTIVLILILRANIKNNILKEFKSIGIYKSMGYSSKKIRRIYLYGYGLVSIVSSLIGVLISIPLVSYICNIAFKNLGEYKFDLMSFGIVILTFVIFNALIYVNLYLALRFIDKIKPVEAINIGLTSSKEKIKKSIIKNNSSSLAMAINDVFKHKKNNIIILIMFILMFYISTLFINVANTMLTLDEHLYKIFGTVKSDFVISAPTDVEDSIKDIKAYLNKDSRVEDYYLWDVISQNKVAIDNSKYKIEGGTLLATIYNKFNEDDFSIMEGLNPRNKREVSLSVNIMKKNNIKIGDYVTLNIEGKAKEFLVVGSYGSMMSGGQSLRVTSDVISDSSGNVAFVKLKNIDDYESLKKDIEDKFTGVIIEKQYGPLKDAASQVVETSVPISIVLLIGVLIFGLINIVNILITNNFDNRKSYGIMKSLGFDSRYIRRRSNYRIMGLAILGGLIGVSLTAFTSSGLMKIMLGFNIFEFSLPKTFVLVGITYLLIALVMSICNRSIKKISTVELIEE